MIGPANTTATKRLIIAITTPRPGRIAKKLVTIATSVIRDCVRNIITIIAGVMTICCVA